MRKRSNSEGLLPSDEPRIPQTVNEAVQILLSDLPLRDKATIARMREEELTSLQPTLGTYVRNRFSLWSENTPLMQSFRLRAGTDTVHEDDASAVIIMEVWKELRKTHALRVLK